MKFTEYFQSIVHQKLKHLTVIERPLLTHLVNTDQPTYYHLHIHIVHIQLDAGATQAIGKAIAVDHVISQLETLDPRDEGLEAGMQNVTLGYTLGEQSELWVQIFGKLKGDGR